MKTRVKCANCGMIYDILVGDFQPEQQLTGECPGCKSNAFDTLPMVWRQYGDTSVQDRNQMLGGL